MQRISQQLTVTHVSPGSAFKVGVVAGALGWVILGLISIGITLLSTNSSQTSYYGYSYRLDVGSLCISYFIGIIIVGIVSGIGAAIYAWIYNLAAGWVGGLEISLEGNAYLADMRERRPIGEKPKRVTTPAPSHSAGAKICPDCGHSNMSWRSNCENCGAKLG